MTKRFPYVRKRLPDLPERFPDIRKWLPDIPERFPDIIQGFPDFRKWFPDIRKSFPDMPESFPDIRKSFPDIRKCLRDVWKCRIFPKNKLAKILLSKNCSQSNKHKPNGMGARFCFGVVTWSFFWGFTGAASGKSCFRPINRKATV